MIIKKRAAQPTPRALQKKATGSSERKYRNTKEGKGFVSREENPLPRVFVQVEARNS